MKSFAAKDVGLVCGGSPGDGSNPLIGFALECRHHLRRGSRRRSRSPAPPHSGRAGHAEGANLGLDPVPELHRQRRIRVQLGAHRHLHGHRLRQGFCGDAAGCHRSVRHDPGSCTSNWRSPAPRKSRRLGNSRGSAHGHASPRPRCSTVEDIQQTPGADRTNGVEMITDYVPATYVDS